MTTNTNTDTATLQVPAAVPSTSPAPPTVVPVTVPANEPSMPSPQPKKGAALPGRMNEREKFELVVRKAKLYSSSSLVPTTYQGNEGIANCYIALNMAERLGADELMVMQNLYIVSGRPGWSSQFLIATFNQCGKFSSIRYEFRGEEGAQDRACRACAIERETGERLVGTWINWKMVKSEGWDAKKGSKWMTMPEQMFQYRAAAFFIRSIAPELAMGLQTREELHDVYDGEYTTAPENLGPPAGAPAVVGSGTKADTVTAMLEQRMAVKVPPTTIDQTTGEVVEVQPDVAVPVLEGAQMKGNAKGNAKGKPEVTEEVVTADLWKATNQDTLDEVAILIGAVDGDEAKERLTAVYAARSEALAGK